VNNLSKSFSDEIKDLEKRINDELRKKQQSFRYKINKERVEFEREQIEKFKKMKLNVTRYLFESSILTIIVSPFIYFMLFPAIFLDLSAQCYQFFCFPVYRITKVRRSEYVVLDRHHLKYLNIIERINCTYCGYFNGVVAFVREIASRTEQYWCPIRHALKAKGLHSRQYDFISYGDPELYREKLKQLREVLQQL